MSGTDGHGPVRRPWYRRGWVLVVAGAVAGGLVVAGLTAPDDPAEPSVPTAVADGIPVAETTEAEERMDALALIRQANAAIAADDTAQGRALLAAIEPAALDDARIGGKVVLSLTLARTTDRYLRAQALAADGAYVVARTRMLGLMPFRRAGALADAFGTRAAQRYLTQARGVYVSRPGRALQLLARAEELDPDLGAIDDLRDLARGQRDALAAPPAPAPAPAAPAPAVADCDPNYSGACIPNVPYDLNCGDVAAVDFASIGSDPHGFDREGDGVACES